MRLLTLLTILIVSSSFNKKLKYFSGKLIYKQTYKSDKVSADSLMANSPNGSFYLLNDRYYKGLTYGKDSALFILDGTTGRSLYKTKKDDGFTCVDNTTNNMKPGTIKHLDNVETINGFKCKSFEVTLNGRRSVYYYSIEYKMNPTVYSKHNKWNWKQLMEAAEGGITIKSVHSTDSYDLIIELDSLNEYNLDNKEFKIKETEIVKGC